MTIAVTGASGQLGRRIVSSLMATEPAESIVAIVRDPSKLSDLTASGVDVRTGDYTNRSSLDAALAGVDSVILVSSSEVGQRYEQHKNVIDAAVDAGVSHLIYTSLLGGAASTLALAVEHGKTEEYLAQSGLTTTILRNGWYSENYETQIEPARATGVVLAAVGDGIVASASRDDYAAAAAVVAREGVGKHGGAVYELSGDTAWNYDDLASAFASVLGRSVTYERTDTAGLVAALTGMGLDEGTAGFVAGLDEGIAQGALAIQTGDLSRLIGRPTTPLHDTLAALVSA